MKTIETWFLWLMIYSVIGWVYESTICSIGQRKLINRGFLNGPYRPILRHGCGAGAAGIGQNPKSRAVVLRGCGSDVQSGIPHVMADGKAVPRQMVGLLEAEIQHRGPSLPHRCGRVWCVLGGADSGFAPIYQKPHRQADGTRAEHHLRDAICRYCIRPHRDREGASRHARGLCRVRGASAAKASRAFRKAPSWGRGCAASASAN